MGGETFRCSHRYEVKNGWRRAYGDLIHTFFGDNFVETLKKSSVGGSQVGPRPNRLSQLIPSPYQLAQDLCSLVSEPLKLLSSEVAFLPRELKR